MNRSSLGPESATTFSLPFLIGAIALLFASFVCLVLALMKSNFALVFCWLGLTTASAYLFRRGANVPAFSMLSIFYTLPWTWLAVSILVNCFDPPPAGPVGGHGINMGIQIVALSVGLPVMAMLTSFAFWFEKRSQRWYILAGLLYLPAMLVAVAVGLQFI